MCRIAPKHTFVAYIRYRRHVNITYAHSYLSVTYYECDLRPFLCIYYATSALVAVRILYVQLMTFPFFSTYVYFPFIL